MKHPIDGLQEELCTIKVMILSLAKSISKLKDKDLTKWEEECRKIATQYIDRKEKEAKDEIQNK